MSGAEVFEQLIKNVDSPFTEIFSRITKYQTLPNDNVRMAYSNIDLLIMKHHINNAVEVMLQGLQDVGNLLSAVRRDKELDLPAEGVGDFISATCNLIGALNLLSKNAEYSVNQPC